VPKGGAQNPRDPDAPEPGKSRESSGGIVFVNKATGGVVASLLIFLVFGLAYVGSTFFTRELQFDHLREQQKQLGLDFEELLVKNQKLERHLVELATRVENLEDSHE